MATDLFRHMRPQGKVAVVLTLLVAAFEYWRDEGPTDLQLPLVSDVFSWLPSWGWLTIGLCLALGFLFEGAYREIVRLRVLLEPDVEPRAPAEKGLLDFAPDGIEAMQILTKQLQIIIKSMSRLNPKLQRHVSRFQQVADDPQRRRKRAADAAGDIDEHAQVVEACTTVMRSCATDLAENYVAYFETVGEEAIVSQRQKIVQFRAELLDMIKNSKTSRVQGITGYRDSVANLRQLKLSQALNESSDRLTAVLDDVISIMQEIEASCRKIVRAIDARVTPRKQSTGRKAKPRPQLTP
ncbi:MAG: hypothetical protein WEB04_11680 [Dehalococcoidia bacterium]